MSYQLADMNNGPYGDTFDTLEAAAAALGKAIEEGTLYNMREGDMPRATAESMARSFYTIVEAAE
ncbi:hypothetical protein [Halomonas sp. RA08-2]|uniref:hypothetical protein n=1 Tax=Halomonas sp. RA08-2 TaxID=3440842 RepID=UPI003EEC5889